MNTIPTTLHHVLAATDLSAPSRHAADRAARVARATGANVTLLHAMGGSALDELRGVLGLPAGIEEALIELAARDLRALALPISERHGVPVTDLVVRGPVADALADAGQRLGADLVVLGARGAGYLRRWTLGSTAERLLRRSHRPLLVVRQAAHEPYRRVLVAVDFSDCSGATVTLARRVAPQAQLVLMHAWSVPFESKLRFAGVEADTVERLRQTTRAEALARLQALAAEQGLQPADWAPCLVQGDAALRIVEQEQEQDCDLIAVGKHGRHAAEDLLLGSVTRHVLDEAQGDVLVAPQPAT